MRIYADVLAIINAFAAYIQVVLAGKLCGALLKPLWCGAVCAGFGIISVFCVACPDLALVFRIVCLPLAAFLLWGKRGFVKNTLCLTLVSIVFAGVMYAYTALFQPDGFVFAAGALYFNISFYQLLLLCGIAYAVGSALIFVCTYFGDNSYILQVGSIFLHAVVDSGNLLVSPYNGRGCVLCDISCPILSGEQKEKLLADQLPSGFVYIPVMTATGQTALASKNIFANLLSQKGKLLQKDVHICVVFGKTLLPPGVQALLPLSFKRRATK